MEALSSLGINGKMLIAQIINFLILLFLLNKLLYKPLLNIFDERRQKIDKGLKDAEASTKALEKARDEADKIREKAYADATEILDKAKAEADQESKKIIADAHNHGEKILLSARDEAQSLKTSAMKEAKSSISDLISLSLGKIVHGKMDDGTRQQLTREAVKELE